MEGGKEGLGGSCFSRYASPAFVRDETVLPSEAVVMVGGSSKHGSFTCKGQQRSQRTPRPARPAAQLKPEAH